MNRWMLLTTLPVALGLGLALNACRSTTPNPEHCVNASGDETCAELYGSERPFCTKPPCMPDGEGFHGCVAERPVDDCYFPCGGETVIDDDSCLEDTTETETGTETGETDSTDAESTETGPACEDDDDCMDAAAPFCDPGGECVACDGVDDRDAACASLDPSAPLCADGECVQCTAEDDSACDGATPVCDTESNTCVACSNHEQCPESACNLAAGNCLMSVVHVDGTQPCADGDGSQTDPYCDLEAALEVADDALIILHPVLSEPFHYAQSNAVGSSVAIFGAPGEEEPVVTGTPNTAAFSVTASGRLFLRDVEVSATQGAHGLRVVGQAWVESSRIINNADGGIEVDGGGSLILDNSFVGDGALVDAAAIMVTDGTATITYSTIGAGFGSATALSCTDGGSAIVRNSLLVTRTAAPDEVQCGALTITSSALETDIPGNTALGDMDVTWFEDDVDGGFNEGNFHLSGDQPGDLATAAAWVEGDPATDIDGDPRPAVDGSSDFAGADLP